MNTVQIIEILLLQCPPPPQPRQERAIYIIPAAHPFKKHVRVWKNVYEKQRSHRRESGYKLCKNGLTLFRPGWHIVPPYKNHRISSKRLGVWSFCFMNFLSSIFPYRKFQLHQSAFKYVAMAAIQLFNIILKTWISIVFQKFPHERNFLWDNLLYFGHFYTLRS